MLTSLFRLLRPCPVCQRIIHETVYIVNMAYACAVMKNTYGLHCLFQRQSIFRVDGIDIGIPQKILITA